MTDSIAVNQSTARASTLAQWRSLSETEAHKATGELLSQGGRNYVESVLEGLRPRPEGRCETCGRGGRAQLWAIREYSRAINRGMGRPDVAVQIVSLVGADLERARKAVSAYGQVEGMDEAQIAAYGLETLRRYHEARGRRVLIVEAAEPGGANNAEREDSGAAMIPGPAAEVEP